MEKRKMALQKNEKKGIILQNGVVLLLFIFDILMWEGVGLSVPFCSPDVDSLGRCTGHA